MGCLKIDLHEEDAELLLKTLEFSIDSAGPSKRWTKTIQALVRMHRQIHVQLFYEIAKKAA
jgi:hypothetical protein